MSNKNDWQAAYQTADEQAKAPGEPFCRADDVKAVLHQLAEQIADADRRHSAALQDMHQRLSRLGGQTESVKASLPKHLAAAFVRIEDGINQLAEQLAETDRERHSYPTPQHPPHAVNGEEVPLFATRGEAVEGGLPVPAVNAWSPVDSHPLPTPSLPSFAPEMPAMEPQGEPPRTHAEPPVIATVEAPPPLKSAIGSKPPGTWGLKEPHKDNDPLFVQNPDDPWDQHSAADLARLYESGEAGLPPLRVEADAAPTLAATVPAKPAEALGLAARLDPTVPAVAPPTDVAGADRTWLDARLSDIAARVERSMMDLRPDSSVAALGERFETFEQRFVTALDGVATRSDVEGLRIVEAHIAELADQIDRTRSELSRLDAIETQLAQLRATFSDEELVRLLGGLVPTEDDLDRFAEQAATRVANRLVGDGASPAIGGDPMATQRALEAAQSVQSVQTATSRQLQSMQEMLAAYMDERRRGEAQTADVLDTMQQAMQHVLDRVDAIEARQLPMAETFTAAPMPAVEAHPATEPRASAASLSRTFAEEAKAAARLAAQSIPTSRTAARGGDGSQPTERIEPSLDSPVRPQQAAPILDSDTIETEIVGRNASGPQQTATAPRTAPAPVDRQAFIAMARRAAEQAKAEGDRQAEAVTAKKAEPKTATAAPLKDRLLGGVAGGAAKSSSQQGLLLVAGLTAFVVAGYLLVSKPNLRSLIPGAAIQRSTPATLPAKDTPALPQKATQPGPAIDTEATPAAPEPAGPRSDEPPAQKRRNTVPETGVDDLGHLQINPGRNTPVRSPSPAAEVQTTSIGIAIDTSPTTLSAEEMLRARQKAHLASLSQRTALDAARTSSVPANRLPGGVIEPTAAPADAVPRNEPTTLELPVAAIGPLSLRLAAAKGDPSAQFDVAARFAEGRGVKQDFEQAAVWYQRAANKGFPQAQYRLAALYERGIGVQADPGRARLWYKRAAEQGNLKAMHNLAVMSAGRDTASADYTTALQWFQKAAQHGLSDSQFNLGVLTESGMGIEKDEVAAYTWFALAARNGDKEAARRRDALRARLDAQQIEAGDAAVAQWRAKPTDRLANDPRVAAEAWKQHAQAQ